MKIVLLCCCFINIVIITVEFTPPSLRISNIWRVKGPISQARTAPRAVFSYLRDNLKMVDGSRVAVWGQGYGGGAAAALAADDARNVTRCLAAVAPLTDLRHHSKARRPAARPAVAPRAPLSGPSPQTRSGRSASAAGARRARARWARAPCGAARATCRRAGCCWRTRRPTWRRRRCTRWRWRARSSAPAPSTRTR